MTGCVDAFCVSRSVKYKDIPVPSMNAVSIYRYIVLCYLHIMYILYAVIVFPIREVHSVFFLCPSLYCKCIN